jgi:hypothetical protein
MITEDSEAGEVHPESEMPDQARSVLRRLVIEWTAKL